MLSPDSDTVMSLEITSEGLQAECQWLYIHELQLTIPVLHYLLPDHLNVFKALHAADVVHQDVGVGIANTSAAQIQPLLKKRHTKETVILKH